MVEDNKKEKEEQEKPLDGFVAARIACLSGEALDRAVDWGKEQKERYGNRWERWI